ncbi:MAG: 3-isopropylmalate dehydrogenase, partial [Lentisphaerae bacterium]
MLKIAVIGGDGIGPEVVAEGLKVIETAAQKTGLEYVCDHFDISGSRYLARGGDPKQASIPVIEDDEIERLRNYDAIYFGAVGHPDIAPGILERGLLLKLRFDLDQYINLRPVRLFSGVESSLRDKKSEDIDFVVIRENTEDLYCGIGGRMRVGTPAEVSTQTMVATRYGVERCLRFAFETARRRKNEGYPGKLTLVHKTNVLIHCGQTWFQAFEEIGEREFPEIEREYHHVDACCMYMATRPELYDVIVTSNMFGDIITDLGAAIAGGMGMAASGNINPEPGERNVSMYEPVHGSAPDIAGKQQANPVAAILSAGMMLIQTGYIRGNELAIETGRKIEDAVCQVLPKLKEYG